MAIGRSVCQVAHALLPRYKHLHELLALKAVSPFQAVHKNGTGVACVMNVPERVVGFGNVRGARSPNQKMDKEAVVIRSNNAVSAARIVGVTSRKTDKMTIVAATAKANAR